MTVSQRDRLPKWQIGGKNCQNGRRSKYHTKSSAKLASANIVPQKNIFQPIFFS